MQKTNLPDWLYCFTIQQPPQKKEKLNLKREEVDGRMTPPNLRVEEGKLLVWFLFSNDSQHWFLLTITMIFP